MQEYGDNGQYAHPGINGKCLRCGSESHNLQACTCPRRQQSSRSSSAKAAPKKTHAKPKGKTADAKVSNQGPQDKNKEKASLKARIERPSLQTKAVTSTLTRMPRLTKTNQKHRLKIKKKEDPEAYLAEAQTSDESEMDADGMLDWSASECKDYKDRAMVTVARARPDSSAKQSDTWEWEDLVV